MPSMKKTLVAAVAALSFAAPAVATYPASCPLTQSAAAAAAAITPLAACYAQAPIVNGLNFVGLTGGVIALLSATSVTVNPTVLSQQPLVQAQVNGYLQAVISNTYPTFTFNNIQAPNLNISTNFSGLVGKFSETTAKQFAGYLLAHSLCTNFLSVSKTLTTCLSSNCSAVALGYCGGVNTTLGYSQPIAQSFTLISQGIYGACELAKSGAGFNVAIPALANITGYTATSYNDACTDIYPTAAFGTYMVNTTAPPTAARTSSASSVSAGLAVVGSVLAAVFAL